MPGGPMKSDSERRLKHDLSLHFPEVFVSCSTVKLTETYI
jgi:hypothetical protein